MKSKTIAWSLLSILVPISTWGWVGSQSLTRVVFLKGNDLLTANADGSDVRVLVRDKVNKADPRWSPDRRRIMYRVEGDKTRNPNTHARLIVITTEGSSLKNIPVLATENDGTIVGGMRFVEESGWLSDNALYALGSANPRIAEYRILDATTGREVGGYLGTGFVTCAPKGQVAYVTTERAESGGDQIAVNGNVVYTSSSRRDPPIDHLQWSNDCNRLAFTEGGGTGGSLIVIRGRTIEAKLPLRADQLVSLTIIPDEQSFLLQGTGEALYYDPISRTLRTNPAFANKVIQLRTERERVLKKLDGSSADW